MQKRKRLVKLYNHLKVQHQVDDSAETSKQATLSNRSFGIINLKAENIFDWVDRICGELKSLYMNCFLGSYSQQN